MMTKAIAAQWEIPQKGAQDTGNMANVWETHSLREAHKTGFRSGFSDHQVFEKFHLWNSAFQQRSQNCQKKKGSGNAEGNLGFKQQHIGRRMDESPPGWFLVAFITHLHMKKIMQGDVCTTSVVGHDSSYPTGHLCFT